MDRVLGWIAQYGYPAIFLLLVLGIVGLPIPDETLLIVCGALILKGTLKPVPAVIAAVAGSWCGISLSYGIGRYFGPAAVHRFGRRLHLSQERLDRVHAWFNRIGHWALSIGYFIVGVRHLTAIVAGISGLEFRTFALYAWSGGLVWVLSFVTLGYLVGENWREIGTLVDHYMAYVAVAVAAGVVAFLAARAIRRRRSHRRG